MKSSRLLWGVIILLFSCLAACKKEKPQSPIPDSLSSLQELFHPAYQINADSIHQMIRIGLNENPVTPWDSVLLAHYQEKDEFFWLNDSLISDKPVLIPTNLSRRCHFDGLSLQRTFLKYKKVPM